MFILLLVMLLLTMLVPAPNVSAAYRLSITGAVSFIGESWTAENFTGYVIIEMGAESQSELDITLEVSGDIASWLTWHEDTSITLFPSEKKILRFNITMPSTAPDRYTSQHRHRRRYRITPGIQPIWLQIN